MAIVSYLLFFCSFICSSLRYFLPILGTYKQFVVFVLVLFVAVLFKYFFNIRFRIDFRVIVTFVILTIVGILFYISPYFVENNYFNGMSMHRSFLLALFGQTFPCILMASFVSSEEKVQYNIKRLAPVVGVMFSIIAFIASFNPGSETSGGFAITEEGLNYQHISYIASFSSALLEYYILTFDYGIHFKLFRLSLFKYSAMLLLVVNLLSILVAGGRGGFVSYFIFLFLFFFFFVKKKKLNFLMIYRILLIIAAIVIIGYFVFKFASTFNISTNGFKRILGLLNGDGDNSRTNLALRAFQFFLQKPIAGYGFGSIFLLFGIYSHNFFVDALTETGIIGTLILVVLLSVFFKKCFRMIKFDLTDSFWLFLFLCGFIMSLFSGYWLAQLPLWFSLSFVLNRRGVIRG